MNRTRMSALLWPYIFILLFSSCATIFNKSNPVVFINSIPPGAQLYDENDKLVGTMPFDIMKLGKSKNTLTVRKEGYENKEVNFVKKSHYGYLFLDAMLLCIPCIVDIPNEAYKSYERVDTIISLRKVLKEHERNIIIAVGDVKADFNSDKPIGKINGEIKKLNSKDFGRVGGMLDNLDEGVITAMENSYLTANYESRAESERNTLMKSKLIIRPVITKMDFNLSGRWVKDYKGKGSIEVSWKIYKASGKDKLAGEITTQTTTVRYSGNTDLIMDGLMGDATRDFLNIDTLHSFLLSLEENYYSDMKGDEIIIKVPPRVNFTASKDILKNAVSAVVTVEHKDGFGSGVIISKDGYLITNYHVVGDEKHFTIKLNQEIKLYGEVVKVNKDYDLALLKIQAADLRALNFADSDSAEIGDDIYAIGTPMATSFGQSITKGIISGFRDLNGIKYIQTDVSINPGNSGGPMINEKGEVIGITTMKLMGKGIDGIGFGIPSNAVLEMLNIKMQ